jgi:imidazolonepropionase-like amidohydrolase
LPAGGRGSPYDDPDDEGFTVEEIRAVVDEVRRHGGKAVAAHAQATAGIRNAIRGGTTSIEHGYGLDDRACDLAREHDIYVVPTLSTVYAGIDRSRLADHTTGRRSAGPASPRRTSPGRSSRSVSRGMNGRSRPQISESVPWCGSMVRVDHWLVF